MSVYPLVVDLKNDVMERLEILLADGLNTTLDCIVDFIRGVLSKEQKKSDFRPTDEDVTTGTCTMVRGDLTRALVLVQS